jgi:hypothetical protein
MSTKTYTKQRNSQHPIGFSQSVVVPRAYNANLTLAQISGHSNSQLRFRFQKYLVK